MRIDRFAKVDTMKPALMLTAFVATMSSANPAMSGQFDFCVHGFDTAFSQTVSVRLAAEGVDVEEDARGLAGEVINRRVWERRARTLEVLPDLGKICQAAAGDRISLVTSVDPEVLKAIRAELAATKPSPTPTLDALAERVTVSYLMSPGSEPSVQRIKVFYATNRHDRGSTHKVDRYTGERSTTPSFGTVDVDIKTEPEMKWLRSLAVYRILPALRPEREVRVQSVTPMAMADWRRELSGALNWPGSPGALESPARPGVLLFIHGYRVTFKDAALRTAQLAADLAFAGAPMFYSWPSKGTATGYLADKESARASAIHLKTLLEELAALPGSPSVYVIAHSMGNEVLVSALQSLYQTNKVPSSFREIVLAAPDVDAERFETEQAKVLVRKDRPRITLYASKIDLALNISDEFHDVRRLGDTSRGVTIVPPMDTVDATAVKVGFLGHSYYGDSQTVMSDLFYLIRKGLPPPERFALEKAQTGQGGVYWKFK
jgi:esterase/lipase superfamily enzyme